MAETFTANFGWTKPEIGASIDAWGGYINADLDGIDGAVRSSVNDNRIINGDMRIDQRNNGASGTAASYTVDRWKFAGSQVTKGTWQRFNANNPAMGFQYCLGFTSSSAYTATGSEIYVFLQSLEADAISDFAFGTAGAQPITLSFWAQSNQTGTFSGVISSFDGSRAYPFSFSLPTTVTWTKCSVTIPGDTAGTWVLSGNGGGLFVAFDLGSGPTSRASSNAWTSTPNVFGVTGAKSIVAVNGATFFVTGVKLEIGSVATPYNRQSLAKSMADCQRYFVGVGSGTYLNVAVQGYSNSVGSNAYVDWSAPVTMRSAPTIIAAWGGGVSATGGAISAQGDNRTIQSFIQSSAAGSFAGGLTITSLSAEL